MMSSGETAAAKLRDQLNKQRQHYYIKRVQSQVYLHQLDNRQADEIKAAYFGHHQFSIYTACVYYRGKVEVNNFGLLTQENDHGCDVTFKLHLELIEHVRKFHKFPTINFWSDGCSSQFRSQYTFYMLTKFPVMYDIEWHFLFRQTTEREQWIDWGHQ